MVKRLQVVAQVVGLVTIGMLALFGILGLFNGTNPVMAALGPRAPQAPQAMEPSVVSYQGMLYDDLGAPLSGEYDLTFRLYDDPIAPVTETLWTESISGVTVRDGRFSVLLGDTSPIDAGDFAQANTYLGIQVGSYDELVPRQRFATVPYAFYATRASGLTAPDGDPYDALYVDDEGGIGIGTTSPTNTLPMVPLLVGQETGGTKLVLNDIATARWGFDTINYTLSFRSDYCDGAPCGDDPTTWPARLELENDGDLGVTGDVVMSGSVGIRTAPDPNIPLIVGEETGGTKLVLNEIDRARWNFGIGNYALIIRNDNCDGVPCGDDTWSWPARLHINNEGDLDVTGDLSVAGNLGVTGDLNVTGDLSNLTVTGEYTAESWHEGWKYTPMASTQNSICFLTRVVFEDIDDNGEQSMCAIDQDSDNWRLGAFGNSSNDNEALCSARCLQW